MDVFSVLRSKNMNQSLTTGSLERTLVQNVTKLRSSPTLKKKLFPARKPWFDHFTKYYGILEDNKHERWHFNYNLETKPESVMKLIRTFKYIAIICKNCGQICGYWRWEGEGEYFFLWYTMETCKIPWKHFWDKNHQSNSNIAISFCKYF